MGNHGLLLRDTITGEQMSETEKKAKPKKETPEEIAAKKIKKNFEKVKVKLTPRHKHDQRRAVMSEPVPFDPDGMSIEDMDKRWNFRKTFHYPIETEVEITRYALNQFKKAYTSVKRAGEPDQSKGENAADFCKEVKRFIIEEV